jgi:hypothetical protein
MQHVSTEAATKPPPMKIRSMTYEDVPQVVDMHLRLFDDTSLCWDRGFYASSTVTTCTRSCSWRRWVVEWSGITSLSPTSETPPGKALSLYTAVAGEPQGRGIAKGPLWRMVTDAARGVVAIEGQQEDDPALATLRARRIPAQRQGSGCRGPQRDPGRPRGGGGYAAAACPG